MLPEAIEERLNVSADGKRFRCDYIREGPINYADIGQGIEVLRRETILRDMQTMIGAPLVIRHCPTTLTGDRLNALAHGRVDKVGFDAETGWFFCEGTVDTDEGRAASKTMRPSCGFRVNSTGAGGRWNNIPYDRELTSVSFHHLALEDRRVRFEEADFRLNAITNPNGNLTMKLLFWKKDPAKPDAAPASVEHDLPAETEVTMADGSKVRLNALVEDHELVEKARLERERKKKAAEKTDDESRENAITDETTVVIDGKNVTVKELKASHVERQNAVTAAANKAAEDEKRGKEDFERLNNAKIKGGTESKFPTAPSDGSLTEGLKRGIY